MYFRSEYVRLYSRSIYLTINFALAFLLLNMTIYLREYFGREYFQCKSYAWIMYFSFSIYAGGYSGNLFTYLYRLRIQRDQGLQLIKQKRIARVNSKAEGSSAVSPSRIQTQTKSSSFCYFFVDFMTMLKHTKDGRVHVAGLEDKDDRGSASGTESAADISLNIFSSDSQSDEQTWILWERIKEGILQPMIIIFMYGSPIFICGVIRIKYDPIFENGCRGCSLNWIDYAIITACLLENTILLLTGLYAIRNEADPLGVMADAKLGVVCNLLQIVICIIQFTDPGHLYKDYKFTWDIGFSFFSCILFFPLVYGQLITSYLERRSRKVKFSNSSRKDSIVPGIEMGNRYSSNHLPPVSLLDVNLILNEPRARNALLEHSINELSSENLVFVFKVRTWKSIWDKESFEKVNKIGLSIYNEYVTRNAKKAINISNGTLARVEKEIEVYNNNNSFLSASKNGDVTPIVSNKIPISIFDESEKECLNIIKTDTLPRFRNSELFKERIVETGILGKVLSL